MSAAACPPGAAARVPPPLWRHALGASLLLATLLCAGQSRPSEQQVEAAYLVNFLRFTQWPSRSFAAPQAPFIVTVVGSAAVAATVRAVADAAGSIDGRPIEVHSIVAAPAAGGRAPDLASNPADADALRRSHLVFFHASAGRVSERELAQLSAAPVLTVGDTDGFTTSGGMLELSNDAGHVVFEANPAAIRDAGLMLSAKVLKLARSTVDGPP